MTAVSAATLHSRSPLLLVYLLQETGALTNETGMAQAATPRRDRSIASYRAKRNFRATPEPSPSDGVAKRGRTDSSVTGSTEPGTPIFVVQKHQAQRAGLHWDFRLEHNGTLWSWAVRKGPSMDPADKRLAAHVEDHPLDYADFEGTIPDGNYGAGTVETWDRGTWQPLIDPDDGLRDGEIKFVLSGARLHGKFTLVRLKPRSGARSEQDNWLLIKGRDADEQPGGDAATLEAEVTLPKRTRAVGPSEGIPLEGAKKAALPKTQAPALASVGAAIPKGDTWLSEIKFDGYRMMAFVDTGTVRIITRNGKDWTDRLPALAAAVKKLPVRSALLDGELVAPDEKGVPSFPLLQAHLSDGHDGRLVFYLFDLLHLDGWDLRGCRLIDRKQRLQGLDTWQGMLRYSDHQQGDIERMRDAACGMGLEGIICKRSDAPYRAGRKGDWLKIKCQGREEFVVLGWTEPQGRRTGFGALHLGYYDSHGDLHYAGGCGTGFSEDQLADLSKRLNALPAATPRALMIAGEDPERGIHWVQPTLVAETSFIGWSGSGRVRHAVFLGLREDKTAQEVVHEPADAAAERRTMTPAGGGGRRRIAIPAPPERTPSRVRGKGASSRVGNTGTPSRLEDESTHSRVGETGKPTRSRIVIAKSPKAHSETIEGVAITHPDRAIWPGITKLDLAEYWQSVADVALPGLAHRPLAVVRCPGGIDSEHFFQKHAHGSMPPAVREGSADKAPFLAIDGLPGLIALAQMSAIELHAWGATEDDPLHADQLVFDLDPGEGVKTPAIVAAAQDLREKLKGLGLSGFCRTSGGKGLHVVVPLVADQGWDAVRGFCRSFAEAVSDSAPDRYLAHVKIADRKGRILIDWLRNGLGSTAIASFSPRARPQAGVATPLSWDEVTPALDLGAFTLRTVPDRLRALTDDPWAGFDRARAKLPRAAIAEGAAKMSGAKTAGAKTSAIRTAGAKTAAVKPTDVKKRAPSGQSRIVTAKAPRKRG
jgi:bifunctional non-homologous end joining protein LigD